MDQVPTLFGLGQYLLVLNTLGVYGSLKATLMTTRIRWINLAMVVIGGSLSRFFL